MPIRAFLTRPNAFDEEAVRVMGLAFERARSALNICLDDPLSAAIAMRIIELAQSGERDSIKLCDVAIEGLAPLSSDKAPEAALDRKRHAVVRQLPD